MVWYGVVWCGVVWCGVWFDSPKLYLTLFCWMFGRIENATSLDVRLVYIAVIIPLGMFGSRYQEIGMYAEEAYREFEAAGQPHVKVPFPTGVESCLKLGSYVPRLMQGDLDELEFAFRKEHLAKKWLMGPSSGSFDDGMGYFGMSRTAESSWEPRRSARVSAWHRRMTEWIIQHKGSKYALVLASVNLPCHNSDCFAVLHATTFFLLCLHMWGNA